jgi:hypothetical protein
MRWTTLLLDVCIGLLSGVMYGFAERESKTGLCELVCAGQPNIVRVVPCFVLPVAGCAGHELYSKSK